MPEDIVEFHGTQFSSGGTKFHVNESGYVTCDDGMDLGHTEECLEDGGVIIDLLELFETINFGT